MTPRSHLLFGETLAWVTYDPMRTVSAALRSMLREGLGAQQVQLEIIEATSAEIAGTLVEQQRAGLLTLVLGDQDWPGACKSLRRVQLRRPQCLRCVYARGSASADELLLLEAGAQFVVDRIPWLQQLVPSIIQRGPRKAGGSHPVTAGLIDRLPWSDVV